MAKRDYKNKLADNVQNFQKPTPPPSTEELIQKKLGIGPYEQETTPEQTTDPVTPETVLQPVVQPIQPVTAPSVPENTASATSEDELKLKLIEDTDFRQTYYVSLQYMEALRILSYQSRKGISETLRDLLDTAFATLPTDIMKEAKDNLMRMPVSELQALKTKKRNKK